MPRNAKVELEAAQQRWGPLHPDLLEKLESLTNGHCLSVRHGDLILLNSGWYATHTGLLRLAQRRRCTGIRVSMVDRFCDPHSQRWAFKATVYRSKQCRGFVGYGDADPSNVSPLVRGAEMRVAETRAVNRALRKAYGIGLCSVEELGSTYLTSSVFRRARETPAAAVIVALARTGARSATSLCQIIRQHQLDPNLVKAYAVDFCGVKTLKDATREQVETFVKELSEWAEKDRNALLCQLNSYLGSKEGAA